MMSPSLRPVHAKDNETQKKRHDDGPPAQAGQPSQLVQTQDRQGTKGV
jgi:hypothetical protein